MKNLKYIALILLFSFLFLSASSQNPDRSSLKRPYFIHPNSVRSFENTVPLPSKKDEELFKTDQILVQFVPSVRMELQKAILSVYRTKAVKLISTLDIHQLRVPEDMTVEEMVYVLKKNPLVKFAEPNRAFKLTTTPNDPLFYLQYALSNSGQAIGDVPGSPQGKASADIKAPMGWEESKGREDVIIGVIDTGLDFDHPDLQNKYVSKGKDFANGDDDATDDHGHGTYVASIIAAETDNNIGIAGVAWNCKVLPAKVFTADEYCLASWVIEAILWLVDQGVDVINFSIGLETTDPAEAQALENAIKYAYEQDIVLVASAGNDSGAVLFPAAFDDYVLAVAATDYNDSRTIWSNFGPEIDVAAPGVRIWGCVPVWFPPLEWDDNSIEPYSPATGTSASAPHVSGLAALIRSVKPNLEAGDVMNIIRYSSDDVNQDLYPGKDQFVGHGRINAENALVPLIISPEKK
jgi:thermitase